MNDIQFDRFKKIFAKKVGVDTLISKKKFLEMDLGIELLADLEMNFEEIIQNLEESSLNTDLWQSYLVKICNPETFFFREKRQFESLLKMISNDARGLRIWSVPCSSGEEVYSLAMFFIDHKIENISILGSDVRNDILEHAAKGIYNKKKDPNKFSNMSEDYMRFFVNSDPEGIVKINESVKSKVSFSFCNVLDYSTYPNYHFDIIFCRNLFIYLEGENKEKVVVNLWRKIAPGGCLCIGTSDYISKYFSKLEGLDETYGDSIYRKVK